ncbi:hypothetical protein TVAG_000860 [Trichomonas vaginalis G3]|uniref:Uncharacterized protein n=1 Tax=Trichomonas vaginalis (strain ATCC PRA-98 / G3) TaxID=412133 RepID=A2EHW2_TRIV3|nr:hypothetical protein TVAGG3_0076740 [Trichomonas vaginalis G3]EAY07802.1 hypothetical protein TVAG_000860 [Trichomonas vaginalis G3]KAI5542924.1 hypothetical protein TVAGG3_0076740 [Trichomonas vaginalis G3]|eukprot:XP_001320025.1 hypothetical protein [Trichomonas vaginalis G3]
MSSKEKSKHLHHDRSDKERKENDHKDKDSKKEKKSKKGDDDSKAAQEPMPQWAQLPVNKNDDPFRDDFEVEIKFKE